MTFCCGPITRKSLQETKRLIFTLKQKANYVIAKVLRCTIEMRKAFLLSGLCRGKEEEKVLIDFLLGSLEQLALHFLLFFHSQAHNS